MSDVSLSSNSFLGKMSFFVGFVVFGLVSVGSFSVFFLNEIWFIWYLFFRLFVTMDFFDFEFFILSLKVCSCHFTRSSF